jgi:hypothetical protein
MNDLLRDPKICAYAELAMEQILRYSPSPRINVYASGLVNENGALILIDESLPAII